MRSIDAVNPRTGAPDTSVTAWNSVDIARAADRLRVASADWASRPLAQRVAVLSAWADDVAGDAALLEALIRDTGRVGISELECAAAPDLVAQWAAKAPAILRPTRKRNASMNGITIDGQLLPFSLVGFITPWNSPLGLSLIDAIPALIAGCTVLIKPSEITPRFIEPLRAIVARHPEVARVVEVVSGDGTTGAAVVDAVDLICFTGSVDTGRKVAKQAAGRLIPAFLELGGKDPAIVLADAALDRAAGGIAWSGFMNTGQTCHSIERVYVAREVFEPFLVHLASEARKIRVAYHAVDDGDIGPFISPHQAAIVAQQLAEAIEDGAVLRSGGAPWQHGGWWMEPTILTAVSHDMRVMREETFGPLVTVMPFDSEEEAVELANDTIYGLTASIWGNAERAHKLAKKIRAGGISVNDASLHSVIQDGEKMAFGVSGLGGTRMGEGSIRRFVRSQSILTNALPDRSPWWFQ